MSKVLVIDDDEMNCSLLRAIFRSENVEIVAAHDGPSGLQRVAEDSPDLIFLDLNLPGMGGLEVLEKVKAARPQLPVIMLTGDGEVRSAVRATKLGAFDYLTKPVDHEEIVLLARRAIETQALYAEVEELRRQVSEGGLASQMGSSPQVRELIEQVRVVAASNF